MKMAAISLFLRIGEIVTLVVCRRQVDYYLDMRDLSKLLTKSRKITISALDHRGSLQRSLHPNNPQSTTSGEMLEWKKSMVNLYKDMVSGILIDPIYGKKIIDTSFDCGWMLSMEKTGYRGGKQARITEIHDNWSVAQARQMGASGVKMLLYYDPENKELAKKQKELARKISRECANEGMVFLLEPLSYRIEGSREKEVLNTVKDLCHLDVDIWKFEYPGTEHACLEISKMINSPWVLLSAGMRYAQYRESLEVACRSGASGFAVGRAVWQELENYEGEKRNRFLQIESVSRMRELVKIVEQYGASVR